jgi:cob(I)alamin adenosyltransferase
VKIYTRTGDEGETSLFGGGRVSKGEIRVSAYGDIDELNSAIGAATACGPSDLEHDLLESIQRDLFAIGGKLATPRPEKVRPALEKAQLGNDHISTLEEAIDRIEEELPKLTAFVLPGGSPKAAALHVARTVCRRAERQVVELQRAEDVDPVILVYLNRLSDLLFVLARLANKRADITDRVW